MPQLYLGDCLDVLRTMPDCSVDAVVTDPPYGLSFMGKRWDYDVPATEVWAECLRVLKPGGHLLAFAGTRTQHRMAVRIEDAGFEIRDLIAWVYGSGFPKSLDVSKAIDKAAGHIRATEYEPNHKNGTFGKGMGGGKHGAQSDPPATEAAQQWQGWGTALKPALEPITVARKPLVGTVAENVLAHGTGALNIDGCRVVTTDDLNGGRYSNNKQGDDGNSCGAGINARSANDYSQPSGRWPANLIHDGSEEVLAGFPMQNGRVGMKQHGSGTNSVYGKFERTEMSKGHTGEKDTGSAARFFYCAKASKQDRDEGLDERPDATRRMFASGGRTMKDGEWVETNSEPQARKNSHPTVKPTDLMRYLCRLITPPGGVVLDPFMGSGSTGKAAIFEGFRFIGIERDPEYLAIAEARIRLAENNKPNLQQPELFDGL